MIHSHEEVEEFRRQGITVISSGDKEYPKRLENLAKPPGTLYCKGDIRLLLRPAVAVVGTRNCTRYGADIAKRFAQTFADSGLAVVSGLADGIDTFAHIGAGARNTIAVLGNGINVFYPPSNRKLQQEIADQGLIISEYLPNDKGSKFYFPQRNRIIAALSQAVLIVEADFKSGAMITKDWALDLGIDVFAVPGPITNFASRGTNYLIKTAACAIATEPADILQSFGTTQKSSAEDNKIVQISFEEKQILDILGRDEVHIDELLEKTGLPIKKLATLLTQMEMGGLIQKSGGNSFTAK
jgi:DNA processing protein